MSYSNYEFEDFDNIDEFEYFEQGPSREDEENVDDNDDNHDNNEEESSLQSRRTSPAWKYFNDQTSQHPGCPMSNCIWKKYWNFNFKTTLRIYT
jgi:hypothetical protein